jgi:Abortive infection C-terminus
MSLSRRSQQKFAAFAAACGTVNAIADVYDAHGFSLSPEFEPAEGRQRRSVCEAAEAGANVADPAVANRLVRVYVDGIEDWGRRPTDTFFVMEGEQPPEDALLPAARALVRSLQRDGVPVDDDGNLVLTANPPALAVERFDRLAEPRVLLDHLARIEAGITSDPAAAIASSKELVESALKFVLNDYGVEHPRSAQLPELYKLAATELRLSRESVPESARGSQIAQRVLQNLSSAVQGLAELRNELGLGHGRTTRSPALTRHARLAANSARAVTEFILDTWHERRGHPR